MTNQQIQKIKAICGAKTNSKIPIPYIKSEVISNNIEEVTAFS